MCIHTVSSREIVHLKYMCIIISDYTIRGSAGIRPCGREITDLKLVTTAVTSTQDVAPHASAVSLLKRAENSAI